MMPQRKIVAIGGGELKKYETLAIDKRVIELTGKQRPKALFIPTASGEPQGYIDVFHAVYGEKLGCVTDALLLLKNPPDKAQLEEKILGSDLIYVGGGNTLKMMKVWRRLGVDQMLLEAAHRGIVLSGLSAGAICWFRYGHSDSPSFTASGEWNYMRVRGLSLIDTMYCPHYHAEKREQPLENMILKRGGHAIACDNNTAIEILDGHYRILGSQGAPKAYKIFKRQGKVIIEKIVASEQLQPIEELF